MSSALQTLVIALVMFAAVLAARLAPLPDASWAGHAISLAVLVGVGATVFLVGARLLKRPELGWLLERSTK